MPWGDGTGPMGYGPMTGRGAGYCAGHEVAGSMNPAFGRCPWGRGRSFWGRGGGRGWRNRFYITDLPGWTPGAGTAQAVPWGPPAVRPNREQGLELLKRRAAYFNEALEDIRRRIEELSKEKKD